MARTVDPDRTAARREAITVAAGKLFAEQGFEGTTAAQIARDAGLSSGSVFYYFADKRAVFRSIFERDIPVSTALVERTSTEPDPMAAVLTMVDELAEDALLPYASGILVELLRQVDKDPELAEVVVTNAAIVHGGLTALIERGIQTGAIDTAYLNANPARDPRPMLRRIVSRFLAPTGEGS